jgi:hypothetical protein
MKAILAAVVSACIFRLCAAAEEIMRATPQEMGLAAGKLGQVKTVVQRALDKHQTAGAVVLVARRGKVVLLESVGR